MRPRVQKKAIGVELGNRNSLLERRSRVLRDEFVFVVFGLFGKAYRLSPIRSHLLDTLENIVICKSRATLNSIVQSSL